MGFNHRSIGYETVQQMFQAFQADARNQIASLFRFMTVNGLIKAVQQADYATFARVYNGPGQANDYAALIRRYLAAFDSVRGTAIARG
ncbi:MAG TPA: N-acetylmuramidase domain-containing protein, partial [Caldilineaceae bacterium]|nr:N-acetylmuramidase domain-containing protein [Caldilineaceae bacterium]